MQKKFLKWELYEKKHLNEITSYLFNIIIPSTKMWLDYDEEADVLYVSFEKPQNANDSIMENNFIYHYRSDKLVGITVLNAKSNFPKIEIER